MKEMQMKPKLEGVQNDGSVTLNFYPDNKFEWVNSDSKWTSTADAETINTCTTISGFITGITCTKTEDGDYDDKMNMTLVL